MNRSLKKWKLLAAIVLWCSMLIGCAAAPQETTPGDSAFADGTAAQVYQEENSSVGETQSPPFGDASLTVHFLDVGQGNAILATSEGHAMLIDGGPADSSSYVVSYLNQQGIDHLDYLIVSHYDADHVSGIVGVLKNYQVDTLLNPDYETDTKIYRSYINARDENGCDVVIPDLGAEYSLGEAEFTVVAPVSYDYRDANNNSIGVRLTCGATHFLLLGDAEMESEYDLLDAGMEVQANVYMVSHHGSDSSSTERLLEAVAPEALVISAGEGNSYGHPAADTMERLMEMGAVMYRTDKQGTITAVSDGKEIRFEQEPCTDWTPGDAGAGSDAFLAASSLSEDSRESGENAATAAQAPEEREYSYIGNKNSKKFHRPTCSSLPAEANRIYFRSRDEAIDGGYEPCKRCNP